MELIEIPKIQISVKEKDGSEYSINASGWFVANLKFSNIKTPKLKEWIKKYSYENEVDSNGQTQNDCKQ